MPNLLAVLVSAVACMVIGAIYYGPLLGKQWMAAMNVSEDQLREAFNPLKSYLGTFIGFLLAAYALGSFLHLWAEAHGGEVGVMVGIHYVFIAWLGFVLGLGWQAVAYEDKSLKLFAMNMAYNLLCLLATGAILGAWQ